MVDSQWETQASVKDVVNIVVKEHYRKPGIRCAWMEIEIRGLQDARRTGNKVKLLDLTIF